VKTRQELNVFISSPGDVKEENKIAQEVINGLNGLSYIKEYVLIPRAYVNETPPLVGSPPQFTVDNYMMRAEDADIFVCIFWSRFGSSFVDPNTKQEYQSGTEYEFLHAYESFQKNGKPIILLYRCMRPVSPDVDSQQLTKVQKFFNTIKQGQEGFQGYFNSFNTSDEFKYLLQRDLLTVIDKDFRIHKPLQASDPSLSVAPSPQPLIVLSATLLRAKFLEVNTELRNYPSLIGGRHPVPRVEISQIVQWISNSEEKLRLGMLIDKPGSGKTVVMAQVLNELESKSTAVLAIKSDYLSGIKTDADLQERLDLPASIEKCVRALAAEERVVVLIDQLDALSVALSQDFAALDLIYGLVLTLIRIENVRVVIS
jgi:hypothetical protein